MDKTVIEDIFNDIITNFNIKCNSPKNTVDGSNAPSKKTYDSLQEAVSDLSEKYGFTVLKSTKSAFTLHDDKNDVTLDFTSGFLNSGWNPINWRNDGLKDDPQLDIEDVFKGYADLPDTLKENVHMIKFRKKDIHKTNWDGITEPISKENKDGMVVTLPDFLFATGGDNPYQTNNYFRVLAHELSHTMDMPKMSTEDALSIRHVLGADRPKGWGEFMDEQTSHDREVYSKWKNMGIVDQFQFSYTDYNTARRKNTQYQIEQGYISEGKGARSKSSDYGSTAVYEDSAECASMVTLGYKNPDNPYAKVKYNDKEIQYKEWIKMNPYTAQVMIKRIYGEDVSIDKLLK